MNCLLKDVKVGKRFSNMFSGSSPCLLGQHGSCSSAQLPVELSENMLQNLLLNLPPQTVGLFYKRGALCIPVGPLVAPLHVVDDDGAVHPKVDFVPRTDVDLGLVLGPLDVCDAVEGIVSEVARNRQPLPGLNRYDLVRICGVMKKGLIYVQIHEL